MNNKSKKEMAALIGLLILLSISIFSQLSRQNAAPVSIGRERTAINRNAGSNEVVAVDLLLNEPLNLRASNEIFFNSGSGDRDCPVPQGDDRPFQPPKQFLPAASQLPDVHYLGFHSSRDRKWPRFRIWSNFMSGKLARDSVGNMKLWEIAQDYVILKLPLEGGKMIRVPFGGGAGVSDGIKMSVQQ